MTTSIPDPFESIAQALDAAVVNLRATWLRPEAFFVARSGVLTLAYSGYTKPLVVLKRTLETELSLPAERPGSRWPKTTLAALRDGAMLTRDDVVNLKQATFKAGTCLLRVDRPLRVDRLHVVELLDRAMSRTGRVHVSRLGDPPDDGRIDAGNRAAVNSVLSQWRREGLPQYMPDLLRPGFRESHYRCDHRELTLVIPVGLQVPCLDALRRSVEAVLPGRYAWFDPPVLHVTLRTLGEVS